MSPGWAIRDATQAASQAHLAPSRRKTRPPLLKSRNPSALASLHAHAGQRMASPLHQSRPGAVRAASKSPLRVAV